MLKRWSFSIVATLLSLSCIAPNETREVELEVRGMT
jgi:hypothetical protein